MSAQRTPGPWRAEYGPDGDYGIYSSDSTLSYSFVAQVPAPHGPRDPLELYANARLIAAAPALLEALEALYESRETWPFELGNKARAAIAQARGEQ